MIMLKMNIFCLSSINMSESPDLKRHCIDKSDRWCAPDQPCASGIPPPVVRTTHIQNFIADMQSPEVESTTWSQKLYFEHLLIGNALEQRPHFRRLLDNALKQRGQ